MSGGRAGANILWQENKLFNSELTIISNARQSLAFYKLYCNYPIVRDMLRKKQTEQHTCNGCSSCCTWSGCVGMSAGDKIGWSSIHMGKSSLNNLPGKGTELLWEPESSCPSHLLSHRKIQKQPKPLSSGLVLPSPLSASGGVSKIHFHQAVAQHPDHALTVRPLEAISGRVRVAGVVRRFRALESCNITASISCKITYSTLLSDDPWIGLDSKAVGFCNNHYPFHSGFRDLGTDLLVPQRLADRKTSPRHR